MDWRKTSIGLYCSALLKSNRNGFLDYHFYFSKSQNFPQIPKPHLLSLLKTCMNLNQGRKNWCWSFLQGALAIERMATVLTQSVISLKFKLKREDMAGGWMWRGCNTLMVIVCPIWLMMMTLRRKWLKKQIWGMVFSAMMNVLSRYHPW